MVPRDLSFYFLKMKWCEKGISDQRVKRKIARRSPTLSLDPQPRHRGLPADQTAAATVFACLNGELETKRIFLEVAVMFVATSLVKHSLIAALGRNVNSLTIVQYWTAIASMSA